jgi:hypothetical protein
LDITQTQMHISAFDGIFKPHFAGYRVNLTQIPSKSCAMGYAASYAVN